MTLSGTVSETEAKVRLNSVRRNNLVWRLPMGVAFFGYKNGEYIIKLV